MTDEADCSEMFNLLLIAVLPPLHHRERVYLQIENNSAQYERFVAGARLTHNTGWSSATTLLSLLSTNDVILY